MNTAQVREKYYNNSELQNYAQNPIEQASVIKGVFYKENLMKEMAIRKINMKLCMCLIVSVAVAFVSYYMEMSNEITLNTLSRQVTTLNDENAELQNSLDKLKSFNNVDSKMSQQNLLQKAGKVIEVPAVAVANLPKKHKSDKNLIDLAFGY